MEIEYTVLDKLDKIKELNNELKKTNEYIAKLMYIRGIIDGIRKYAWWKNGIQYVGTTGKTLEKAIKEIEDEYKDLTP